MWALQSMRLTCTLLVSLLHYIRVLLFYHKEAQLYNFSLQVCHTTRSAVNNGVILSAGAHKPLSSHLSHINTCSRRTDPTLLIIPLTSKVTAFTNMSINSTTLCRNARHFSHDHSQIICSSFFLSVKTNANPYGSLLTQIYLCCKSKGMLSLPKQMGHCSV